jgi:DNA-binding PadR family transcriptional regulator
LVAPHALAGPARTGAATRLLILGCVRIFQPVHGYFLRRELLSWQVDEWANVHPGSIYNALQTLTRAGLLHEGAADAASSRPKRTAFELTDVGERDFLALLRTSLAAPSDPVLFLVAVNFAMFLRRDEVVALLSERIADLRAQITAAQDQVVAMLDAALSPPAATEATRVVAARLGGELGWAEDYVARVRAGAYSFLGEKPDWTPTAEQIEEALEGGAGARGVGAAFTTDVIFKIDE